MNKIKTSMNKIKQILIWNFIFLIKINLFSMESSNDNYCIEYENQKDIQNELHQINQDIENPVQNVVESVIHNVIQNVIQNQDEDENESQNENQDQYSSMSANSISSQVENENQDQRFFMSGNSISSQVENENQDQRFFMSGNSISSQVENENQDQENIQNVIQNQDENYSQRANQDENESQNEDQDENENHQKIMRKKKERRLKKHEIRLKNKAETQLQREIILENQVETECRIMDLESCLNNDISITKNLDPIKFNDLMDRDEDYFFNQKLFCANEAFIRFKTAYKAIRSFFRIVVNCSSLRNIDSTALYSDDKYWDYRDSDYDDYIKNNHISNVEDRNFLDENRLLNNDSNSDDSDENRSNLRLLNNDWGCDDWDFDDLHYENKIFQKTNKKSINHKLLKWKRKKKIKDLLNLTSFNDKIKKSIDLLRKSFVQIQKMKKILFLSQIKKIKNSYLYEYELPKYDYEFRSDKLDVQNKFDQIEILLKLMNNFKIAIKVNSEIKPFNRKNLILKHLLFSKFFLTDYDKINGHENQNNDGINKINVNTNTINGDSIDTIDRINQLFCSIKNLILKTGKKFSRNIAIKHSNENNILQIIIYNPKRKTIIHKIKIKKKKDQYIIKKICDDPINEDEYKMICNWFYKDIANW
jgi:hypothetical protein